MQFILFSSYFISASKNLTLDVSLLKNMYLLLKNSSGYENDARPCKNFLAPSPAPHYRATEGIGVF